MSRREATPADALRESQRLLQSIIDTSTAVIYVKDLDGRYLLINRRYEELFHVAHEEIVGKTDYDVFPKDRADAFRAFDQEVLAAGTALEAEELAPQDDGLHTYISIKAPLYDSEGSAYAVCGISTDITERKRVDVEREWLEAELRQAQKLEGIGRLAGGVAHDFNNLLTAIGGYTELLLMALPEQDPRRADAEEVRKAVDRAAALTRQLLAFSRRQIVQRQSLDLNEIVLDMDRLLRRLIGSDVELVTLLAPDLGHVEADRGQLEQVIVNLALNARDAMPEGGKLVIETGSVSLGDDGLAQRLGLEQGDYVTLRVSDTGVGMDPETKVRVFDPFFTTKETGRGTGLGLSTVFGIVEQSGGRIHVTSGPGQGSTFEIHLPQVATPVERVVPRVPVTSLSGTETVLLVEDEEVLRVLAARTLREQGYEVLEARYASEALELWSARQGEIQVVVTDIVMPGVSGVDLAERLLSDRPEVTVVLMSGFADSAAADQVDAGGGRRACFLEKPFTPQQLLRTVREAIEQPA